MTRKDWRSKQFKRWSLFIFFCNLHCFCESDYFRCNTNSTITRLVEVIFCPFRKYTFYVRCERHREVIQRWAGTSLMHRHRPIGQMIPTPVVTCSVLSLFVKKKNIGLSRDAWVRVKIRNRWLCLKYYNIVY